MATRRLYRSRNDRIIWGVCGGLAEYFDIDPVIVRIIFVLLIFAGGAGIVAYIVMGIIVPLEGSPSRTLEETTRENAEEIKQSAEKFGENVRATFNDRQERPVGKEDNTGENWQQRIIIGVIIIVIGIIFLISSLNIFQWFSWHRFWPLVFIIAGLLIIFTRTRRR